MNTDDSELVEQLHRVDSSLEFRGWTRRRIVALTVFVVLDLVATLLSSGAIVGVVIARRESCDRDNALRSAYVTMWQPVLALPVPALPPDSSEQQKQMAAAQANTRRVFQANLNDGFAQHGCTAVVDSMKWLLAVVAAAAAVTAAAVVFALRWRVRRQRWPPDRRRG